ncbi:aldehyde dehydrogenase family protein [Patescibacteria group bacterium]|nr:aldehyde dehydrogenase family protein [Patescibacteria group bacterium]
MNYLEKIPHWINNEEVYPEKEKDFIPKFNPATGKLFSLVARGKKIEADKAISSAIKSFENWSETPVVKRAEIIREATQIIQKQKEEIAVLIALEAGKSFKDSMGEMNAAIEMGFFVAGEGARFYGKTTTSAIPHRSAMTMRQPVGICALINPANNPVAGFAWKVFPALLCGNTAVLKPSENTPYTSIVMAKILKKAGLLSGALSVIQGLGKEAGQYLIEDHRVDLISFTGSVQTGKQIQQIAGKRLAKICLELGGKNALIVCDDANLENAAESAVLSAFSSAGQRCASGSRIIVFDSIFENFKKLIVEKTNKLKIGVKDDDNFGPLISKNAVEKVRLAVNKARSQGAKVLSGGQKFSDTDKFGYYFKPTILENVDPENEISKTELFGPVTILYKVKDLKEAITLANNSPFGLTAAIHTKSINRAQVFQEQCRVGVVSINGHTYGSEPHMPFGGLRNSGTGWREAGTEALDIYSEWKTIYTIHDPNNI